MQINDKIIKDKIRETIKFCETIGMNVDYSYMWGDEEIGGILSRLKDTLTSYKKTRYSYGNTLKRIGRPGWKDEADKYVLEHTEREQMLERLILSIELSTQTNQVHPFFSFENVCKMLGQNYKRR